MQLSIQELVNAAQGELIAAENTNECFSISTDTRTITSADIFLPLSGLNFNGHDYIKEAINKGVHAYFTEKASYMLEYPASCVILVENALMAYLKIANYVRNKINPTVIAVTGSSGKTTTKELIAAVLETTYITHKSILNHNNEIGLCKTLLSMPENCEYVVAEMGMRGIGEIELLSKYAQPDFAVITNIGNAHLGRLGSIENITKAKCEITSYLKPDGVLIAFEDDLIKANSKWQGKNIFYGKDFEIITEDENSVEYKYRNELYEIPVSGLYNVINSLAAIEIAKLAGISEQNIKKGLLNYAPVGERGRVVQYKNNIKFVLDCYNANPESVKASVNAVCQTYKNQDIVLVLADMAELGEQEDALHKQIGEFVAGKAVDVLVTVGEKAKLIADKTKNDINTYSFLSNNDAAEFLQKNIKPNSVVLFKGSRCMKLEEIANSLI